MTRTVRVQQYGHRVPPQLLTLNLSTGELAAHPLPPTTRPPEKLHVDIPSQRIPSVDEMLRELAPVAQRVLDGSSIHAGQGHLNLAGDDAFDELCRRVVAGQNNTSEIRPARRRRFWTPKR